jgi:Tfp pilus assembly protein PilX
MHPRLKLLLLRGRLSYKGFALPIALGVGLILLLVGVMAIVRSQGQATNTFSQRQAARGLAIAEAAVNRYQNLMQKNPAMMTYCANPSSQSPCNSGTTWSNLTASILGGSATCNSSDPRVAAVNAAASTTAWQNLDSSDLSKGQYRLVSYTYTPDAGVSAPNAPGTGTLIVEGRVSEGAASSAGNANPSTATSRLQIVFPIHNGGTSGDPAPGVWITSGGTGNNQVEGDVLLNDCGVNLNGINVTGSDPVTGQPYTAKYTNLQFPDLPPKPAGANNLGTLSGSVNLTLPRVGVDTATSKVINGQSVQVYEYLVNSINMSGNSTLTITPGQRVTFYLDGDIDSQGNSNVVHSCQDAANNPIPNCKPTDFQIFGYGGSGSKICVIGNKVIEAFILAPNYTGGVSGAGGGAGGIKGSVWLGSWSTGGGCGSNTSNRVIQQQARWDELGLTPKNLPPKLGGGGSWARQIVP